MYQCRYGNGLDQMERFRFTYFRFASKLSTIFFDEMVTDSLEMYKIYKDKFAKKSTVIAYGSTMIAKSNSKVLEKFNLKKRSII